MEKINIFLKIKIATNSSQKHKEKKGRTKNKKRS